MGVKLIVVSDEDFAKLPEGINILREESHDSVQDTYLNWLVEDIKMNIHSLDLTIEQVNYLIENISSIALRINDNYSYSNFNEFIVDKLFEELAEAGLSVE